MKKTVFKLACVAAMFLTACSGTADTADKEVQSEPEEVVTEQVSEPEETSSEPQTNSGLHIHLAVEKVGEIPADSFDYKITGETLSLKDENGRITLYDYDGKDKLNQIYDDCDYLYDDIYRVSQYDKAPNFVGLVKPDGTVLIPCEAAVIKPIGNYSRFLHVIYATEKVDKKEDAYVFSFEYSGILAPIKFEPGEGDTLYAGYSKVYDLKNQRFIPELKFNNPLPDKVGDSVLVGNYKEKYIYSADGKMLGPIDYDNVGDYLVSKKTDSGTYIVYDEKLNQVKELSFEPSGIYGNAELFTKHEDNVYVIVNDEGKEISSLRFRTYPREYNGFLCGALEDSEDYYGVIDFEANTIIDQNQKATMISEEKYGFLSVQQESKSYGLIYPDGTYVENISESSAMPITKNLGNNKNAVYLLEKGEFSEVDGQVSEIGRTDLVYEVGNNSKYTVYSAVDGTQILPDSYDKVIGTGNYIYALNGEIWEIYRVSVN